MSAPLRDEVKIILAAWRKPNYLTARMNTVRAVF
jgi:hypothetical protein